METAQTADYALLSLLELERGDGRTIAELAPALGLNRTVAQRILKTLHARSFVTRDLTGRYWLGPALLTVAQNLPDELAIAAAPVLRAFARQVQETVVIAVRDGDEAVIVAREAGSSSPLRVEYEVGFRQPLALGASSLAILAHADDATANRLATQTNRSYLTKTRKLGYARTEGQIRRDMVGLAAPILNADGTARGSLAIVVPSARMGRVDEFVPTLISTADAIGRAHDEYLQATTPTEERAVSR